MYKKQRSTIVKKFNVILKFEEDISTISNSIITTESRLLLFLKTLIVSHLVTNKAKEEVS